MRSTRRTPSATARSSPTRASRRSSGPVPLRDSLAPWRATPDVATSGLRNYGTTMRAMVLEEPRTRLRMREQSPPEPGPGEILLEIAACGVCRTDLHVVDGELPNPKLPVVPGHEIVGRVAAMGEGVTGFARGERIGVPWLGATCGVCPYCRDGRENLCDRPLFTGSTRAGGSST